MRIGSKLYVLAQDLLLPRLGGEAHSTYENP
ncbi:MAG: hypothetical protein RLZZ54_734 [Cyanobacteriota bacterium]|jgi:hypothetical protein